MEPVVGLCVCSNTGTLTVLEDLNSIRPGEMAERPIAPVLKTGVPARVPRVRIPVSPLLHVARQRKSFADGHLRFRVPAGSFRLNRLL